MQHIGITTVRVVTVACNGVWGESMRHCVIVLVGGARWAQAHMCSHAQGTRGTRVLQHGVQTMGMIERKRVEKDAPPRSSIYTLYHFKYHLVGFVFNHWQRMLMTIRIGHHKKKETQIAVLSSTGKK